MKLVTQTIYEEINTKLPKMEQINIFYTAQSCLQWTILSSSVSHCVDCCWGCGNIVHHLFEYHTILSMMNKSGHFHQVQLFQFICLNTRTIFYITVLIPMEMCHLGMQITYTKFQASINKEQQTQTSAQKHDLQSNLPALKAQHGECV